MRRGPRGGLVVTAPDATAAHRSATLVLQHAAVDADELHDTRAALELSATRTVAKRIDADGARRLREAVGRERAAGPAALETGQMHDFHVVLAELTGKRRDEAVRRDPRAPDL
jgi:DNA-binding FadR family transcriptional regulator